MEVSSSLGHRASGGPGVGCRVVDLAGPEDVAVVGPATDGQDAAVVEQHDLVVGAAREHALAFDLHVGGSSLGNAPGATEGGVDVPVPGDHPVAGPDVPESVGVCGQANPLAPGLLELDLGGEARGTVQARADDLGVAVSGEPELGSAGCDGGGAQLVRLDEGPGVDGAGAEAVAFRQGDLEADLAGVPVQGVVVVGTRGRLGRKHLAGVHQGAAGDGDLRPGLGAHIAGQLEDSVGRHGGDARDLEIQDLSPRGHVVAADAGVAGLRVDEVLVHEGVHDLGGAVHGHVEVDAADERTPDAGRLGLDRGDLPVLGQEPVVLVQPHGVHAALGEEQVQVGVDALGGLNDLDVLEGVFLGEDPDLGAGVHRGGAEAQGGVGVDGRGDLVGRGVADGPEGVLVEDVLVGGATDPDRQLRGGGELERGAVPGGDERLGHGASRRDLEVLLATGGAVHQGLYSHALGDLFVAGAVVDVQGRRVALAGHHRAAGQTLVLVRGHDALDGGLDGQGGALAPGLANGLDALPEGLVVLSRETVGERQGVGDGRPSEGRAGEGVDRLGGDVRADARGLGADLHAGDLDLAIGDGRGEERGELHGVGGVTLRGLDQRAGGDGPVAALREDD